MSPEIRAAKLVRDLDLAGPGDFRYEALCNMIAGTIRAAENAAYERAAKFLEDYPNATQGPRAAPSIRALKSRKPAAARGKR